MPTMRTQWGIALPMLACAILMGCGSPAATGNQTSTVHPAVVPTTAKAGANVTMDNTATTANPPIGTGSTGETKPSGSHATYPPYATRQVVPELWSVPKGSVALTIDDGPSPYTERILAVLEKYHVRATFFFIGNRVQLWPNAVRRAVADGDGIGNHSESHPLFTNLSPQQQAQQIELAEQHIQALDPNPVTLFRPPYGAFNDATEQILQQDHMMLALWNRDPRDWAASKPQQVIQAVVNGNPSGGVFDLHDNNMTLQALPTIIEDLQKRGLKFVVLGEPDATVAEPAGHGAAGGMTAGTVSNTVSGKLNNQTVQNGMP
ncbi:MAG: polysaccharide deacetylase family protein [Alicyclobacillus sp.]|nr:polysaccharide deacetylase family protein [Alicyclobacillus sp.]